MLRKNRTGAALSVDPGTPVCGGKYRVRRMPMGRFLEALSDLRDLPERLLSACFPGLSLSEIFGALKQADEGMVAGIVTNALSAAAPQVIALAARLSDIPEEALIEDPAIGPAGLAEILRTVWEINDLKNLVAALGEMKRSLAPQTKPGSSGSSPQG